MLKDKCIRLFPVALNNDENAVIFVKPSGVRNFELSFELSRLDACGETDDDADEGDSSKRACAGADAANRRQLAWCLVSDKLTKRNECSRRASLSRAALPPRRRHTMMILPRRLRMMVLGWTKEPPRRASLPAESHERFQRVLRSLQEK